MEETERALRRIPVLSFEEKVEERCTSEDAEEKVQRLVEQFL